MIGAMASALQLAKVEGDNIVTTLQYGNDSVDFNGRKMSVEEFAAFVMANTGALGAQ